MSLPPSCLRTPGRPARGTACEVRAGVPALSLPLAQRLGQEHRAEAADTLARSPCFACDGAPGAGTPRTPARGGAPSALRERASPRAPGSAGRGPARPQIWVSSPHNATGYCTVHGEEALHADHFSARLSFGDTQTTWARTGYLGFLRRTELTDASGGQRCAVCPRPRAQARPRVLPAAAPPCPRGAADAAA